MDMQKPGPRGRSSTINPGPGAAVECKTPGVARGGGGGGCWCLELTDTLYQDYFVLIILYSLRSLTERGVTL